MGVEGVTTTAPHMQRLVHQWMGGDRGINGKRILDGGAGLGLSSAMMARSGAHVDSVEYEKGVPNVGAEIVQDARGSITEGHGNIFNLEAKNDYDAVNLGFKVSSEEAQRIAKAQLRHGGFMIAPVITSAGHAVMKRITSDGREEELLGDNGEPVSVVYVGAKYGGAQHDPLRLGAVHGAEDTS